MYCNAYNDAIHCHSLKSMKTWTAALYVSVYVCVYAWKAAQRSIGFYEWVSANGVAVIELTIENAMQKWNIITIISEKLPEEKLQ